MTLSRRCRISSRRYALPATRRRRRSASIRSSERSARSSQQTKASPVRLSDEHDRHIASSWPPTPLAFSGPTGAGLTGICVGSRAEYDKKKYVWKLLYIYMLGYPVEFGHKQASDLIAAPKCALGASGLMCTPQRQLPQ